MLGAPAKLGADAAQVNQASPVMTYSNVFDNDMVSRQKKSEYISYPSNLIQCSVLCNGSLLWMGFCFIFIYLTIFCRCYAFFLIYDLMIFCFMFLKLRPFELI